MSDLKQYRGVWIRPDMPCDRGMVQECLKNYKHFTFTKDSRVLDLGGNIGAFGRMCVPYLAEPSQYHVVEPDEDNMVLLKKNTNPGCDFIQAVATMSTEKTLTFYQNESGNRACSGTATPASERSKGHRKIRHEVKNIPLPDLIASIHPSHLKMDIEGGETDWLLDNQGFFPSYVEQFAIELHGLETTQHFNDVCYPNFIKEFELVHAEPNFGFVNADSESWSYPNLGISGRGALFGVDVFLRRK